MDHLFQTELQTSLSELQINLKELEASRIQIQEAKDAATKVVEGMDGLRENYGSYLTNINSQINSFLTSSDHQIRTKINDGITNLKETSLDMLNLHKQQEENNRKLVDEIFLKVDELKTKHDEQLVSINEKVEALMSNSGNRLDDNLTQNTQMIQDLSNAILEIQQESSHRTDTFVENLKTKQSDYLETIQQQHTSKVEALAVNTQNLIDQATSKNQLAITQVTSDLNAHIQQMSVIFAKQQEEFQNYIVRFGQTLETVRELENQISKIDFPYYFKKLEDTTSNINSKFNKFGDQFEEYNKEYKSNYVQITQELADLRKKQSEQITGIKNFLIGIIFLLILVGLAIFFKDFLLPT